MRPSNAAFLVFAQVVSGVSDKEKEMPKPKFLCAFYTFQDLQYCSGKHFCRLASQRALLRKLNALTALNLTDEKPVHKQQLGPAVLGGAFQELHTTEMEIKKKRTEE